MILVCLLLHQNEREEEKQYQGRFSSFQTQRQGERNRGGSQTGPKMDHDGFQRVKNRLGTILEDQKLLRIVSRGSKIVQNCFLELALGPLLNK